MDEQEYEYINVPQQGVPIPQRNDRADLIERIKPDAIVEFIRQRLLGKEWDESSKKWIVNPALKDNALTEAGAAQVANLMLGTSSINTTISRYKEDVIQARLRGITNELMVMLVGNWNKFGIKNTAQFYFVYSIVFSNALAVLSQAGGGSIQELLKGTVTENRNINMDKREPGKLKRMLGLS